MIRKLFIPGVQNRAKPEINFHFLCFIFRAFLTEWFPWFPYSLLILKRSLRAAWWKRLKRAIFGTLIIAHLLHSKIDIRCKILCTEGCCQGANKGSSPILDCLPSVCYYYYFFKCNNPCCCSSKAWQEPFLKYDKLSYALLFFAYLVVLMLVWSHFSTALFYSVIHKEHEINI